MVGMATWKDLALPKARGMHTGCSPQPAGMEAFGRAYPFEGGLAWQH